MDISETLAPASDQLDAIELVSGPRVFTIARVTRGSDEQPVNVHFTDFPRPWRPSKGMRRVLAACWGSDASQWAGRHVELFFDPNVTFGKEQTGGTRIAALSHLEDNKPQRIPLLVSRGKSATFTVQPLKEASRPATITAEQVADLVALMDRKGSPPDKRIAFAAYALKRPVSDLAELTVDQMQVVAEALASRADVATTPDPSDPADPWAGGEQ